MVKAEVEGAVGFLVSPLCLLLHLGVGLGSGCFVRWLVFWLVFDTPVVVCVF